MKAFTPASFHPDGLPANGSAAEAAGPRRAGARLLPRGLTHVAAAVFAAAWVLLAAPLSSAAESPVVQAPSGPVKGEAKDGLHIFKGIPYALPPVGDLRWKPPVAVPAWEEVRDAGGFGPACIQPPSRPGSIYFEKLRSTSEDCLYLNIWAPEKAEKAPVFVWIHGGSLIAGAGSQSMYDGEALAKRGIIVVSINYRLGILGYLAHAELSAESPDQVSGNYGLLDQIEALRWIHGNIAAFGGDPANVTIAGESAGALSVMYLMAAPDARGLFAKAVAQSAYMVTAPTLKEKRYGSESGEAIGAWIVNKLGAASVAELRGKDAQGLVDGVGRAGYFPFPSIDGKVLPHQLVEVFDRGEQAPVPLLAGFNSGEIRSLRFLLPPPPEDAAAYEAAIRKGYGDLSDEFLRQYPSRLIDEAMLAATRDAMYGWTAERLVKKQAAIGQPGYLYLFDHSYPAADILGLHAFHAAEIPYVFGTTRRITDAWPKIPGTTNEQNLKDAMMDYWSSFARAGKPVADGQPDWPAYGENQAYMYFADEPHAATHLLPGMYELHEEVVCRRRAAGDIAWNWNVGVIAPPLPPKTTDCQ
ncbi:carboxylesterase/lipase family protein [Pseudokordiimonas caeni]|uniref:carboxylesterase/lipase family protein n=1 Tax=Pseudokordiimonas caeni TaxID=2997908 RepID=UPI0028117344|nr:carboxylesterase family protein [Pseudokordiimonas caeni]